MRLLKRSSKKAGAAPGTLVHIGEQRTDPVRITRFDFNAEDLRETIPDTAAELTTIPGEKTVTWINVDGIHEVDRVADLGKSLGIHPLVLEDIVNTGQRPKLEDHDEYLFITLKRFSLDAEAQIQSEQVSLILGDGYLVSFCETPIADFATIKDRLHRGKGRLRKSGSDYLAYALVDAIVDYYYVILEHFHTQIETLEEALLDAPRSRTLQAIHAAKRDLLIFYRQIWPLRDILGQLKKGGLSLIREESHIFIEDTYDHMRHVTETTESFRDVLNGLQDLYLSTVSHRMNEVMQVLTIMATIFIPLTFVAGIYGMNFSYMPELQWRWGYFAVLAVMAVIAGGLLAYFKKKNWL
ncbi:MAG: magnesium/cobalt transporter CorA [Desulfosudaceae bacterium]